MRTGPNPFCVCTLAEHEKYQAASPIHMRSGFPHHSWFWLYGCLCLSLVGCIDLRSYEGQWEGTIINEPAMRIGFGEDVRLTPLQLSELSATTVAATISSSDGRFRAAQLRPLGRVAADTLANLSFDGDPLRSYLLFAPIDTAFAESTAETAAESSAMEASLPALRTVIAVLSLFDNDRIELRLAAEDRLYGVFRLQRQAP